MVAMACCFHLTNTNCRISQKPTVQKPFLKRRQYDNTKRAAAARKNNLINALLAHPSILVVVSFEMFSLAPILCAHCRFPGLQPEERLGNVLGNNVCHCTRGSCFRRLRAVRDDLAGFLSSFNLLGKVEQDAFVTRPAALQGSFSIMSCTCVDCSPS